MRRNWNNCTRCGLHETRRHVVVGSGDLPADVMFVGSGPRKAEDMRGEASIGRDGKLLGHAIEDALKQADLPRPPIYFTNVVACRPTDTKNGPSREPTGEESWACWLRLEERYHMADPRVLVFLGKTAEAQCKKPWPHGTALADPASILKRGGEQGTEYRRFVRGLSEAFGPLRKLKRK